MTAPRPELLGGLAGAADALGQAFSAAAGAGRQSQAATNGTTGAPAGDSAALPSPALADEALRQAQSDSTKQELPNRLDSSRVAAGLAGELAFTARIRPAADGDGAPGAGAAALSVVRTSASSHAKPTAGLAAGPTANSIAAPSPGTQGAGDQSALADSGSRKPDLPAAQAAAQKSTAHDYREKSSAAPSQDAPSAPGKVKAEANASSPNPDGVTAVAAGAGGTLSSHYENEQGNPEASSTRTPATSAAANAQEPAESAHLQSSASSALKDLTLQVGQAGAQKVEVRLTQRSGELHVAVRTGDSDLARGLQQDLPDLVSRLKTAGLRADAWQPGGSAVSGGPSLESRASSSDSQKGDSQQDFSGSRQQQGEGRQGQPRRPAWAETLQSSMSGPAQWKGEDPWHPQSTR
ncbi:MAG TPA: hypothetical protein VMU19_08285 [Bryobacteraceae bacterium]|nr:hypothetical protein [Bryobacteraceae bacterium]